MVQRLRELRIRAGFSQQQLADVLGISQQSINKYENHGVEPDIATLTAMAECFQTSVDYLIGHTDISRVYEETAPFDLNREEADLLSAYRRLTKAEKQSIGTVIHQLNQYK